MHSFESSRKAKIVFVLERAMDGFYDLLWHGYGLREVLPEVAVLFTIAAVFMAISASKFRFE